MSTQEAVYTKSLGRQVAKGAKPDKITKIHVISGKNDTWSVVVQGNSRSSRSSLTKSEAITYAKTLAHSKSAIWVVVHDKNGYVDRKIEIKFSSTD